MIKCKDFLKLVWPDQGWFCIMTNVKKTDGTIGRRHYVFDNHHDAYSHGRIEMGQTDVYFGLHTHLQQKVYDPKHQRFRPSRKRENMAECRCFFLDFDCGKSEKDKPKYPDQQAALAALALFLFRTNLPSPYVVSSGNGLHLYWPLTAPMDSATWRTHAMKLKLLLDHEKVLYDPSRVVDTTSVLRLPTTYNHKDPDDLKTVRIMFEGDVTDTQVMCDLLENLTSGMQPITAAKAAPSTNAYVNIVPNTKGFPVTEVDEVAKVCEQVRIMRDSNGCVPEPHWYAVLGVLAYLNNGDAIAHQWSSGYANYTHAETQGKLDQWRSNSSVTGCGKLATDGAQGVCQRCPHFNGQYKNPIVIANKQAVPASAQFVQPQAASATIQGALCDPPWPYRRIASLGVEKVDDKNVWKPILPAHDLYPIALSSGFSHGVKVNSGTSVWVVREQGSTKRWETVVDVPSTGLMDVKIAHEAFVHEGITLPLNAEVLKYMSAYLQALKLNHGLITQESHMGWPDIGNITEFVLNGYKLDSTGAVTKCAMAGNSEAMVDAVTQAGKINAQVDALTFYNDPIYRPMQFVVLAALGSPLMMATGQHGVVLHVAGETGAGKSLVTKAAAGIWGNPSTYIASGTDQGMSAMARNKRAMATPNLPLIVDEITHASAEEMRAQVMSLTQGQLRITLSSNRQIRERPTGFRSMIAITNANASLHEIVNREDGRAGTANSARINELTISTLTSVHTKQQGDDQLEVVLANYGWIGPEFMKLAMPNIDRHFALVKALNIYIDRRIKAGAELRFITAGAAAQFAAGLLARHWGFITWDIEALMDWFCDVQVPAIRERMNMQAQNVSFENILRVFFAEQANNTISLDANANIVPPTHIRDMLVVHHSIDTKEFWVHLGAFRLWCNKRGTNSQQMIDDLYKKNVITTKYAQRILGKGSQWGRVRSSCFIVDATHPILV